MKTELIAALLSLCPLHLAALGPDGGGGLSVGYVNFFPRDTQSGSGNSGPTTAQFSDKDLGASALGASVLLGISDALSAGLKLALLSGKTEQTLTTPVPFQGSVSQDNEISGNTYEGAVRIHSGAFSKTAYEIDRNANPDGWLYWPMLEFDYSGISEGQSSRASKASGFWTGYSYSSTDQISAGSLGGSLTLPLETWLSASMGYSKDVSFSENFHSGSSTSNRSNNGIYESYSLGLSLYLSPFSGLAAGGQGAVFPGIGRVGVPSISGLYTWSNNLESGYQSSRGMSLKAAIAFSPWIGMNAGYQASQEGHGPEDSISGFQESSRQPVSQACQVGLIISFGQHAWIEN